MGIELENALKPGSMLAEFRILEILGAGGFGITYKAYDEHLDDYVAIKEFFPADNAVRKDNATVTARSTKDQDFFQYGLDAFKKEAKTLARFANHPNIVTVRRYLEANGTAYLVMQYEEGQTFGQWLFSHPKPSEEDLLQIFIPVLDGLREVHNQNYLHRDLKPGNIYIRSDGRPMLIDFGSARQALGDRSRSLSVILSEGYAAKEQYSRKGNQGAWTDLYGIGASLWRAISGKDPASATDRNEARDEGEPDPLQPAASVGKGRYSENFLKAIDWALAYLPTERPQTVKEFQNILLEKTKNSVSSEKINETDKTKVNLEDKSKHISKTGWTVDRSDRLVRPTESTALKEPVSKPTQLQQASSISKNEENDQSNWGWWVIGIMWGIFFLALLIK